MSSELEAYDNMGLEYYYIGNIEKACFYHNKMMNCITEKDTDVKKWNLEILEEKHKRKSYRKNIKFTSIFEEFKNVKKHGGSFTYPHKNTQEIMKYFIAIW